jgi:HEAT repeat protein
MDAAAALQAGGSDPAVVAELAASAGADPFWAVRKSSLEALARLKPGNGPDVFKKACLDPDSQVRAAALVALGDLKDRKLVGFYKGLFQKDASYRVQAEALAAIGKAGDPSSAPFLKQAAAVPSYRDMVRRAAESALKLLEGK